MVEGLDRPCRRHDETSRARHGTIGWSLLIVSGSFSLYATVLFFMITSDGPTNRGLNLAVPTTTSFKGQVLKKLDLLPQVGFLSASHAIPGTSSRIISPLLKGFGSRQRTVHINGLWTTGMSAKIQKERCATIRSIPGFVELRIRNKEVSSPNHLE